MKLQKLLAVCLSGAILSAMPLLPVSAARTSTRYYGDVDLDKTLGVTDIVMLRQHLLGTSAITSQRALTCADVTADGEIDIFDLSLLKRYVLDGTLIPVGSIQPVTETPTEPPTESPTEAPTEQPTEAPTDPPTEAPTEEPTEAPTEVPTETPTEPPTEAPSHDDSPFLEAPIYPLYGTLPSQGDAAVVVFYVDFPDCPYTYEPSLDDLNRYCFGTEDDPSDPSYPFNSMHCFYDRSSKGSMNLTGTVIRYTTENEKSYYEDDEYKVRLVKEIYKNLKSEYDFAQYDKDGDGYIDATLINVPKAAGDTDWWPCAGLFSESCRADGKYVGHLIVGNAEVVSATEHRYFVSAYLHELGHCMGLPDYYLYYSEDMFAFHGEAGPDLMAADAYSDMDCFSKLMLGWYHENQVQVYDQSAGGAQSFTLRNAQTDAGNCLILPCGKLDSYFAEYMIVEYITEDANNSRLNKDMSSLFSLSPGIRVYHIYADVSETPWFTYFSYENGAAATGGDDDGIRLIRLANDAEGGNVFTTGDVIDGSISGFHWYDANEGETVDTGYTITVGDLVNDSYTVTVTRS